MDVAYIAALYPVVEFMMNKIVPRESIALIKQFPVVFAPIVSNAGAVLKLAVCRFTFRMPLLIELPQATRPTSGDKKAPKPSSLSCAVKTLNTGDKALVLISKYRPSTILDGGSR